MERESNDESDLLVGSRPLDRDGEDDGPHHGFGYWFVENQGSLWVWLLITAHVFLMLYFVALLALGGSSLVTKIFTGALTGLLFAAFLLIRISRLVDIEGRAVWEIHRKPRIERFEKRVAAALWGLIAIAFLAALAYKLAHAGR